MEPDKDKTTRPVVPAIPRDEVERYDKDAEDARDAEARRYSTGQDDRDPAVRGGPTGSELGPRHPGWGDCRGTLLCGCHDNRGAVPPGARFDPYGPYGLGAEPGMCTCDDDDESDNDEFMPPGRRPNQHGIVEPDDYPVRQHRLQPPEIPDPNDPLRGLRLPRPGPRAFPGHGPLPPGPRFY